MSSYAHFPFKPNEIVLCSLSYSLIFIDLNNKLQTFSHVNKFSFSSESLVARQYALMWIYHDFPIQQPHHSLSGHQICFHPL